MSFAFTTIKVVRIEPGALKDMSLIPTIFFSYSLTKAATRDAVATVIAALKKKVSEKQWHVEDPMTPDIMSIRDKVVASLWDADAAIIEVTTNSPNIMFEAGFAQALSYPTIFLVDPTAHESEALKPYFAFLNLDPNQPLSADLGDIEYLKYPADPHDQAAWLDFGKNADARLDHFARELSPASLLTRRAAKEIFHKSCKFVAEHPPSHPMVGFLGGRLSAISRAIDQHGPNVLETDAQHYHASLATYLRTLTHTLDAKAIADRRADVETFWNTQLDPLDTAVTERLFLVHWNTFFSSEEFQNLYDLLMRHVRTGQQVYLGIKHKHPVAPHVLGEKAIGEDLLLVTPDVVGGYIENSGKKLHFARDSSLYQEGLAYYQRALQESVHVRPDMSLADLRRTCVKRYQIGKWRQDWGKTGAWDNSYFDFYDEHIRCWIPRYDHLVHHCAALTQEAISMRMRQTQVPLKILEIGYGTGALSRQLLTWMNTLNAPITGLDRPGIISDFLGIDSETRMEDIADKRTTDRNDHQRFAVCTAPTWNTTVTQHGQFDVVCGSLVLHDIVSASDDVTDSMIDFLRRLSPILQNNGFVLFSDIFLSDQSFIKEKQLNEWKDGMKRVGLDDGDIQGFFSGNPELLHTLTERSVKAAAEHAGYKFVNLEPVPGSGRHSILGVLTLQKQGPLTASLSAEGASALHPDLITVGVSQ